MAQDIHCPKCKTYLGNCGHRKGGTTGPITISGTCPGCKMVYSYTCLGDCIKK